MFTLAQEEVETQIMSYALVCDVIRKKEVAIGKIISLDMGIP
tara:strand:+ start:1074 stop:1199 length:126 start_codon:yes stop_codon:yes gene_type:complete